MKCKNCGMEVNDKTKFCPTCGSSLEWIKEEKNKKNKKKAAVIVIAACILLGAAGTGYKIYSDAQEKSQAEWDDYANKLKVQIEELEKNEYNYILTDEEKSTYDQLLQNLKNGIFANAKKEELEQYEKEMNDFINKIVADNQSKINHLKKQLKELIVSVSDANTFSILVSSNCFFK